MQTETAWVKPPLQVGGLDHLAVQAPCTNIYRRMLPGITNVTDGARYYSFHPWVIWAFDKAGHREFDDNFIKRFRRADCLFCLIAQRRALRRARRRRPDHDRGTGESRRDYAPQSRCIPAGRGHARSGGGGICLSNNCAERSLRGVALGRKAWLFAGSDRGGQRAAAMYSLIITAKMNRIDPQVYLADVLARIADHPVSRIDELLPWNWKKATKTLLPQAA
jgi:IS66 C-terminal element/Transposase IS66 family